MPTTQENTPLGLKNQFTCLGPILSLKVGAFKGVWTSSFLDPELTLRSIMLIYILKAINHGGQGQLFGPELSIGVTPIPFSKLVNLDSRKCPNHFEDQYLYNIHVCTLYMLSSKTRVVCLRGNFLFNGLKEGVCL